MKNILITGGVGFIGSNFVRHILKEADNIIVVNLDLLTYAGRQKNLHDVSADPRHLFIHGDICDRELLDYLFRKYSIDTVLHFAAETHVDRSIFDPTSFIRTNIEGTVKLLRAAQEAWLEDEIVPLNMARFHHVSTDEVFGSLEPLDVPFTETSLYSPNSPYSASKAASDHFVRAYFNTFKLPITITTCSNIYGPYQHLEKLVPLVINNAIAGEVLPIYGNGSHIRDWLFVEDCCDAILLILRRGVLGETYNIGGDTQTTNLQLVSLICDILGEYMPSSKYFPYHQLIKLVKDRPGHDSRYALDSKKIYRELGWKPKYSLERGLRKTIKWYLENPEWISSIRSDPAYRNWIARNYSR